MSFFDYKPQVRVEWCEQCKRETRQSRGYKEAQFTCRDPQHQHPSREEQEKNKGPV